MYYSRPTAAILASILSLAAALPAAEISAALSASHLSSRDALNCSFTIQFETDNNDVHLALFATDESGSLEKTLGTATVQGGTSKYNFDSQLASVFVVDVPKVFSAEQIKDKNTTVVWQYEAGSGSHVDCEPADMPWSEYHFCGPARFNC